jgi:hypothetical protein
LWLAGLFGPENVDGASGFTVARQEPMNDTLYRDLSGDRNMGWVPRNSYLTYLTLNAPGSQVTYDLGVGADNVIRLASFGTSPARSVPVGAPGSAAAWVAAPIAGALLLTLAAAAYVALRRLRRGQLLQQ